MIVPIKLKRVLMLNMLGDDIRLIQTKLKKHGYFRDGIDGIFGRNLLVAVTNFQRDAGLKADGVVGSQTWGNLMIWDELKNPTPKVENESNKAKDIPNKVSHIHHSGLMIYDNPLTDEEYIKKETQKNTIWLHHTAGGSRPDWTIGGWEKDFQKDKDGNPVLDKSGNPKPLKVGTHFVIGRKSSSTGDILWDGKVLKAFDDIYWAYHLGVNKKGEELNSKSISIEICNYGPLTKRSDGSFYNYVNRQVNDEDVCELETEFRGYKYWEKYTDVQIESLRKLILYLKERWNMEIESGIYNEDWFNYDDKWFSLGGLRTHTQVRKDKFDLFPQPELIQMLNSF